jgi:hypothetical protein
MTRRWDAGLEGCGEGPCAASLVCYIMAQTQGDCLKQVGRKFGLTLSAQLCLLHEREIKVTAQFVGRE